MNVSIALLKAREGVRQVPVYGVDGEKVGEERLPKVFNAPLREDLVRRVFIHLQTHTLQPKGAFKGSGHKYSVESWGAGYGVARVSRIKGRGTPKYASAGMVPSAVGGRPTHPPVPEKKIHKDINKKEKRLALASAIAFTASPEHVRARGHRLPDEKPLPIVVVDEVEEIKRTKEVLEMLKNLGLEEELERCSEKKIRAGKGKRRGRRYKLRAGPLIVVSKDRGIGRAADNILGVDVVEARNLSVLHLAPGGAPGRLTIYTKSALNELGGKIA